MEPLERRILYLLTVAASTPQRYFSTTPAGYLNCLFTVLSGLSLFNSWTMCIYGRTKNNGMQVTQPAPRTTKCKNTRGQLPQSRVVSLVMVQLAPSEQLTT